VPIISIFRYDWHSHDIPELIHVIFPGNHVSNLYLKFFTCLSLKMDVIAYNNAINLFGVDVATIIDEYLLWCFRKYHKIGMFRRGLVNESLMFQTRGLFKTPWNHYRGGHRCWAVRLFYVWNQIVGKNRDNCYWMRKDLYTVFFKHTQKLPFSQLREVSLHRNFTLPGDSGKRMKKWKWRQPSEKFLQEQERKRLTQIEEATCIGSRS